jgi:hypothetical protein
MTSDEIQKKIENAQEAIKMADRARERIDKTLRETRRRRAIRREEFKRLGVLR